MIAVDLDLRRLKRDVARSQASRPTGMAPGGRRSTGSMAVVRRHLPQLDALRAEGATWAEIAAALAAQGLTQGEAQTPITAKRLTALVALVRKAEAKRSASIAKRTDRSDAPGGQPNASLTLSTDLTVPGRGAAAQAVPSEETNRHAALARSKSLLKGTV